VSLYSGLLCALSSSRAFSLGFRGRVRGSELGGHTLCVCVCVCVSVRKRVHCQVFQFLILQGFVLSGKSLERTYQ